MRGAGNEGPVCACVRRDRHASQCFARRVAALGGVFAADLPAKFDPARDAAADVAHAVALAKAQGKRVIVDVGGEWCAWCHIMDRFIAANADVRCAIDAHYVWVKVNFSKQNANEALLSRWPKVAGYPHLFVLDADGALVHSQDTGALEGGRRLRQGALSRVSRSMGSAPVQPGRRRRRSHDLRLSQDRYPDLCLLTPVS